MSDIRKIINLLESVERGESLEEISRLGKAVAAGTLGLMTALGSPSAAKAGQFEPDPGTHMMSRAEINQKGHEFVIAIQDLLDRFEEEHLDVDPEITPLELRRLLAKAQNMEYPAIRWFEPNPNKRVAPQIAANMVDAAHASHGDHEVQPISKWGSPKADKFMLALGDFFQALERYHPNVDKRISQAEMSRLLAKAETFDNPMISPFEPIPGKPLAAQIEAHMENDPRNDGMD